MLKLIQKRFKAIAEQWVVVVGGVAAVVVTVVVVAVVVNIHRL